MNDLTTFTEQDEQMPALLGPEYSASNRLAQAMMEKFEAEHLKPLVDKAADEFRDKLWDDVRDWLLSDTEMNVSGAVRHMVEQTIEALLIGKEWAMQRYPYADYSRGDEIRKAVAAHCGDTILKRRLDEAEDELAKAKETIARLRDERRW